MAGKVTEEFCNRYNFAVVHFPDTEGIDPAYRGKPVLVGYTLDVSSVMDGTRELEGETRQAAIDYLRRTLSRRAVERDFEMVFGGGEVMGKRC